MSRKPTKRDNEAISAIDSYIKEIPGINTLEAAKAWKAKVLSSLIKWFGIDNINTIEFDKSEGIKVFLHPIQFRPANNYDVSSRLSQIKDYIKNNGVNIEYKPNWICRVDVKWLYGSLTAIILGAFYSGKYVGEKLSDKEFIRMENRLNSLNDSLRLCSVTNTLIIPKDKPYSDTASHQDRNNNKDTVKHNP